MSGFAGPRIVTNGLVLHLDAGNPKSYPGSGTTWYDLSGNGNNAALQGSPTYNSSGYFTLDGSTQYATIATTPLTSVTTCTISMWIYSSGAQSTYTGLFINRTTSVLGMSYYNATANLGWNWANSSTAYNFDSGLTIPTNAWSMCALSVGTTSTTFWVNSSSATQTFTTSTQTFDGINIGRDTYNLPTIRYFNGRVATTQLYNRALTPTEIKQNYYAMRGRFGI